MVNLKNLRRGDLRIEDHGPLVYVWSSFAHYGVRALLLPKVTRDKAFVTNEYNHERDEYWKQDLTLDDFIYGNNATVIWTLIDDKLVRAKLRDVRMKILPRLKKRIEQYSKPGDLIVEFGAGTGRNLAYLAKELPDRKYLGLELTPRSVEDANRTLQGFKLPVEMRVADVTQPVEVSQPAAVSYSVLALEQMPGEVSRAALVQMAATAKRAVVCLEPIRELFPYSVRGITSRLRQYRADYLNGLPAHAKALGLNVVVAERTGHAHNPLNEVCELVIET
jgi:SAM-dependent methyltransferase